MLGRQVLQPAQVRGTPIGAVAKHEPAPREKLEEVVPRFEDLSLKRLATPHDVAHALLGFARDAHGRQFAGAVQSRELARVPLVVLALHAWPFRNQRISDGAITSQA
jgi:hypothetical protein